MYILALQTKNEKFNKRNAVGTNKSSTRKSMIKNNKENTNQKHQFCPQLCFAETP